MSDHRTPDEQRTDAALRAALWARFAQHPREDAGDKLRQMKLAFLAAHGLEKEGVRALNLSYYRWTWGPMSNEVYLAWEMLERAGLLEIQDAEAGGETQAGQGQRLVSTGFGHMQVGKEWVRRRAVTSSRNHGCNASDAGRSRPAARCR